MAGMAGSETWNAEYIVQETVKMAKQAGVVLILSAHSNSGRSFNDVRWLGAGAKKYFDMELVMHAGSFVHESVRTRAFAIEVTKDRYDSRNIGNHYRVRLGKDYRVDMKASKERMQWDGLELFVRMRDAEDSLARNNPNESTLKKSRLELQNEMEEIGKDDNIDDFIGEDKKDGKKKKGKKQSKA